MLNYQVGINMDFTALFSLNDNILQAFLFSSFWKILVYIPILTKGILL